MFLDELSGTLKSCNSTNFFIIGSDFNSTISDLERNHIKPHQQSRIILKELLRPVIWRMCGVLNTELKDIIPGLFAETITHPYQSFTNFIVMDITFVCFFMSH